MGNNQIKWEQIESRVYKLLQQEDYRSVISFRHNNWKLAAVKVKDKVFIFRNRCPHMGASFEGGWVENEKVVCPKHRYRFHPEDQNPNRSIGCLSIIPSRIQNETIEINLSPK